MVAPIQSPITAATQPSWVERRAPQASSPEPYVAPSPGPILYLGGRRMPTALSSPMLQSPGVPVSASLFKFEKNLFWIRWSRKVFFQIMKINNYQGELTDISATNKPLVPVSFVCSCFVYHLAVNNWTNQTQKCLVDTFSSHAGDISHLNYVPLYFQGIASTQFSRPANSTRCLEEIRNWRGWMISGDTVADVSFRPPKIVYFHVAPTVLAKIKTLLSTPGFVLKPEIKRASVAALTVAQLYSQPRFPSSDRCNTC